MIQMPTRIAITFQSTSWAASTSVMVPIQIMTTTPSSAATVASSLLTTIVAIVTANTARVSHCNMLMFGPP
jgi:hypothetical protein